MGEFLSVVGWIALVIPCVWVSGVAFFCTADTFSQGLWSRGFLGKIASLWAWAIVITCWWFWLEISPFVLEAKQ